MPENHSSSNTGKGLIEIMRKRLVNPYQKPIPLIILGLVGLSVTLTEIIKGRFQQTLT
jgi:hypothetical protein